MKDFFQSGYIAIIGRPNVGKSTLLNALVGQKVAAVTAKPQTTRHRIMAIRNRPSAQMIFIDTPGLHTPHKTLNERMVEAARSAFADADLFLLVLEPSQSQSNDLLPDDKANFASLQATKKPVLIVINKADKGSPAVLASMVEKCREIGAGSVVTASALYGKGLPVIEEEILKVLPEGPPLFPDEMLTDRTERFLVSEIIREKLMEQVREEIPYSTAVEIEEFKEPSPADPKKLFRIRADIIVDKESQKGIVVGRGGTMIREIGREARMDIEKLLEGKVYLELFVRVEAGWTRDPQKVKEFL